MFSKDHCLNHAGIRMLTFAIFMACSIYGQNDKTKILAYESHIQVSYEQKIDIVQMMKLKAADGFYVAPTIPGKKLKNATERCILPDGEEVLALIDVTLAGHAKNCLLISTSGIYINNGSVAIFPGRFFIPYASFKTLPVKLNGKYELSIGELSFDMSGATPDREFVLALLEALQQKL